MIVLNKRNVLAGLISVVVAPAIVRAENIMPIKVVQYGRTVTSYAEEIAMMLLDAEQGISPGAKVWMSDRMHAGFVEYVADAGLIQKVDSLGLDWQNTSLTELTKGRGLINPKLAYPNHPPTNV